MNLATADDIEDRLGRDLTSDELGRIEGILTDVSASVRLFTGQMFEVADFTMRVRVKRGFVRLSQRPVNSVDTVQDRWGNDVDFEWDGLDRVYVDCAFPGRAPVQVVDVTYNAGPESVPLAIVGIVCGIALRGLGRTPTDGAVVSEQVDGYAYRLDSASGAGSYGLLSDEYRTLNSFRRVGGSIRVSS